MSSSQESFILIFYIAAYYLHLAGLGPFGKLLVNQHCAFVCIIYGAFWDRIFEQYGARLAFEK